MAVKNHPVYLKNTVIDSCYKCVVPLRPLPYVHKKGLSPIFAKLSPNSSFNPLTPTHALTDVGVLPETAWLIGVLKKVRSQ